LERSWRWKDHLDLPLTRHGHRSLLGRILDLATNFSVYDATYVALAEQLDAGLLTADVALARATRTHTRLAVLP
jgi:predicted nucleic acid-binding protein